VRFASLRDADVRGRRVIVREDLNVPMKDGVVGDPTRIVAALETLRYLRQHGARTIVLSHLGRPDGKVVPALSLRPVAADIATRLGIPVAFAEDCVGPVASEAVRALVDGAVVILENVRFHVEEEANDPGFARQLAKLTQNPRPPFVCAIGGAKVKDKVGVFTNLLDRVDAFVIGGGMANTFLAAQNFNVGKSLRDADLEPARRILELALEKNVHFHLPTDAVVSTAFNADDEAKTVPLSAIDDEMILDIGPETAETYAVVLRAAKTIVFNGPMGVYEKPAYQNGTRTIGRAIAEATRHGATTVVGGGDAAAAAAELGFASAMTHVSTGGGATLEFLEGKTLPGVAALERAAVGRNVSA
jgi:phosphoglycerate kinase